VDDFTSSMAALSGELPSLLIASWENSKLLLSNNKPIKNELFFMASAFGLEAERYEINIF
jgi:hypothetical protein